LSPPDISSPRQEMSDTKKIAPNQKAIIFLLIVAFLNTLGVTIIVPVVPFMTLEHLSSPGDLAIVNAWMVSIYGVCQLFASPGLGLLSDRFGRCPVLFVCLFGSAIGYLLFGLGGSLWFLFLGRIIDGLTGGNMSVIYAYLADITESRERGTYFGIAGSVSGVGFIVGPFIGGLLATISYSAPFIVAAAVVLLTLVWGIFFLPESLPKEHRVTAIQWRDLNPLKQWSAVFTLVNVRWLLAATFLYSLPFAIMISNLTVFLKDSLGWGTTQAGFISSVVGIVDIFVQGILVGRLLTSFGDVKVSMGSLLVFAISNILLGALALKASPLLLLAGVTLFAGSSGLAENALRGMTSRLATPHQQGLVGGASQSMTSLATIIGPLLGGLLYVHLGHAIPYWSAALIIILATGLPTMAERRGRRCCWERLSGKAPKRI